LYPLNGPAWTLAYELLANLVAVAFWKQLSIRGLSITVGVAAAVMTVLAIAHGSLDGGYGWTTAPLGLARVTFGFFLGVLLYKGKLTVRHAHPLLLAAMVLAAIFFRPPTLGWAYDLAVAFLFFPVVIIFGASTEPIGILQRPSQFLGYISYPLYALHASLFGLLIAIAKFAPSKPWGSRFFILAAMFPIAWAAARFLDEPVRKWLTKALAKPTAKPDAATPVRAR
jgi:peptidoglycan/LPS O-acetylase OafA/YrhL